MYLMMNGLAVADVEVLLWMMMTLYLSYEWIVWYFAHSVVMMALYFERFDHPEKPHHHGRNIRSMVGQY